MVAVVLVVVVGSCNVVGVPAAAAAASDVD